jgi:hypothetical protein
LFDLDELGAPLASSKRGVEFVINSLEGRFRGDLFRELLGPSLGLDVTEANDKYPGSDEKSENYDFGPMDDPFVSSINQALAIDGHSVATNTGTSTSHRQR